MTGAKQNKKVKNPTNIKTYSLLSQLTKRQVFFIKTGFDTCENAITLLRLGLRLLKLQSRYQDWD